RGWLVIMFVTLVAVTTIERDVVRRLFQYHRSRGRLLRPIVIVGGNREGTAIAADLTAEPTLGYRVVGFTDDTARLGDPLLDGQPVLGCVADTVDIVRRIGVNGVIVATPS